MAHTIVLGAGMVGVSVAWHLLQRGQAVTLIDRHEPGQETSFGNAGIIQREAVRPYAFPRDVKTLLSALPNRRVDIRYRPGGMLHAASPLLRYWYNSGPKPYSRIVPEYASLIQLCLDTHAPMIEASGAEHLVAKDGFLELFRSEKKQRARLKEAQENRERFDVQFNYLDRHQLSVKQPHLSTDIIGAIHWLDSWVVNDPGRLVTAYAESCRQQGGRLMQSEITGVTPLASGWEVTTTESTLQADNLVMALGPWAGKWLKPLGYHLPTFVKRGYHMHYAPVEGASLNHWVMDAEVGYLLAPMRAGTRLTTGAELDDLESPAHEHQLASAEGVARKLFPLGERLDAAAWKGARPCLPDMKPIIGPAPRHNGLWLTFGHGHHGFTLGPATGKLVADMMEGKPTDIDMAPFRVDRF